MTVTAQYTVEVTWTQSQGSVSINGTKYTSGSAVLKFDADADVIIQAIAETGFEFAKFSDSPIGSSNKSTYTISKLNQDVEIQVIFKQAEPEEPEVSEIEIDWIKSRCFKKSYGCQDDLNLDNLYIKVHYKDSWKTESIQVTEDMIRHIDNTYHKGWLGPRKDAYYEAEFQIQYEGVSLKQPFSVKARCYDEKFPTKQCVSCKMWDGK